MFGNIHPPPPVHITSSASACKWFMLVSYGRMKAYVRKRVPEPSKEGIEPSINYGFNSAGLYRKKIGNMVNLTVQTIHFRVLSSPRKEHRSWEIRPGVIQCRAHACWYLYGPDHWVSSIKITNLRITTWNFNVGTILRQPVGVSNWKVWFLFSVLGLLLFLCSLAMRFCFVWIVSTPPQSVSISITVKGEV